MKGVVPDYRSVPVPPTWEMPLLDTLQCARCGGRFDAQEGQRRCERCAFVVRRRWQAVRALAGLLAVGGVWVWWLTR